MKIYKENLANNKNHLHLALLNAETSDLIQYPNNKIIQKKPKPFFMQGKFTISKCFMALMFSLIAIFASAQTHSGFSVTSSSQQCLTGNSFVFNDTSTTGANIASYSWNFGDGTTSQQFNPPAHHYAASGYYSVQLIVTDTSGINYYSNQTVVVNPIPVASFYNIVSTQNGNSYTFISTSTIANGVMDYFWRFGDGTTSTLINPVKSYNAVGNYSVTLIVTSDGGCKDSTTHIVNVVASNLNASISVASSTTQALSGNSFTFNNASNTGTGISFSWNFGSGANAPSYNGLNPTVSYSTTGIKTIVLTSSAAGVASVTDTVRVNVVANPHAVIGSITNTYNNYTFDGSGSTGNLIWMFGDGATSSDTIAHHTYNAAGNYNILLIATNGNKSDTARQSNYSIAGAPVAPIAKFGVNTSAQCFTGNAFTFTDSSTGAGNSYRWTFPNALVDSSLLQNPASVTFKSYGTYAVTLVVTNAGGTSSYTKNVTVGPKPTSSFSSSVGSGGYAYTFFNGSYIAQGTITSYNWIIDGNSYSTLQNPPTKIFSDSIHVVKLATTSDVGCVDTITKTFAVGTAALPAGFPVAHFAVNAPTTQCQGGTFTVNNTSTGNAIKYKWSIPSGTASPSDTVANPTISFYGSGKFTISLLVSDTLGSATYSDTVTVLPKPTASFSYSVDSTYKYTFFNGSYISNSSALSYSWKLNGSQFSTVQNPPQQIFAAGIYTVTLVVTGAAGCKDSTSQTIAVNVAPSASLSINPSSTSQCVAGNSFDFTYTSSLPVGTHYLWSFPNATPSSDTSNNPTGVKFNGYGKYTVTLFATNASGTTSATQTITVGPKPTASFSSSNSINVYSFFNGSYIPQDSISFYNWKLDGITFSVAKNPTSQTLTGGAHTVTLLVTSNVGCVDSTSQTFTVASKPTAAFTVSSASTQCKTGNNFTFNNTTSGSGVSYIWNFGDGTGSGSASPTKSYGAAGTYTIKLFATNSGGTDSTTQTVTVTSGTTAKFGYTYGSGSVVNFHDSSVGASSYAWNFGDGFTSTSASPTRNYASLGTYTVKLITTSATGCKDSVSQSVTVGTLPTASFTITSATTQCSTNNSFTFTNTSTTGAGVTYLWSFGDTTATTYNPFAKTYTYSGTIPVTLTVTNALGSVSVTHNVIVLAGPTASFVTYSNTNAGGSYTFISTSKIPAGTMSYHWSFGDGTTADSIVNPTHTYAAPGTYTVKLVVNGGSPCADSTSHTVTFCPTVTAKFGVTSVTSQCLTGNSFTFADSSTTNATSGYTIAYAWSFGDSTFSALQNPLAHTYAAWGDYDVKLKVTLTSGSCVASDSITKLKLVSAQPMPLASYRLILDNFYVPTALLSDTTKRCWHNGYDFSYQSSSVLGRGTMDYFWHFGTSALYFRDGDSSHYINPRIVFDTAGIYPVKLVVVSDKGCKDSVTRIVHLSDPRSRFNFTIDSSNVYATPTISVTDASYDHGGYLAAWSWNFGTSATPATSALQAAPTFSYACGGTHQVKLTVTSDVGCVVDTTRSITVRIRPHAGFSISAPNYIPNKYSSPTFAFTNTTTVNDACPSLSYAWNFGDGLTSTSTNPTHKYAAGGTYTVRLIVTNANGGKKDTITNNVTVLIKPQADFSSNVDYGGNVYSNPNVDVTDATTSNDAAATYLYAWDFGSGASTATSTSATPPSVTYNAGGVHTIQLIVTNINGGLKDTITHTVNIVITPKAVLSVHIDTISTPIAMSIGNANYKHYTLTAKNNGANPSTIVTGSILHTEIKIDTVYISSSATNQYADVLDADAEFAIQLDTVPNYLFNVTLTVTSNLGVTDVTTATLGASEAGFILYRGMNNNSGIPVVKLPSIGSIRKPVNLPKVESFSVYPNPGKDNVKINFVAPAKSSAINITVYSANGKLIQQQRKYVNTSSNATNQSLDLNVSSISSGTYSIIITDEKGAIIGNSKFVKTKE